MIDDTYKLPRSYINQRLTEGDRYALCEAHAHYLHTVMRRKDGDQIRLFNGQDGEWLGTLSNLKKKSGDVELTRQLRSQPEGKPHLHLFFAPITKSRMDWMVEKAVELGVTDLHPVLTQNTEVRKIKEDRLKSQLVEASEQCERLTLPVLHDLVLLDDAISGWDTGKPFLACLERYDAKPIAGEVTGDDTAILIGPVGGFTEDEKNRLAELAFIKPVSLGENVLRCETATLYALSVIQAHLGKALC